MLKPLQCGDDILRLDFCFKFRVEKCNVDIPVLGLQV